MNQVKGIIVDIQNRKMTKGVVVIDDNRIHEIIPDDDVPDVYIIPGFVDAHIHIESSMLTPYYFAKTALTHGTVATVSDPHEIANVCGVKGVEFMLDSAKDAKLKFFFGAPSCVPATSFETSGASINSDQIVKLLSRNDIHYLSEMMNYPGVIYDDSEVMLKITLAKKAGKPVDGHAPGLRGKDLKKYIDAGISTDHECFTIEEALEKLSLGMKILIREGSAARNFEALHPLISEYPDMIMLCSDDKHPDELLKGHINELVARAVSKGHDLYDVLRCASLNPINHYNLNVGILRKNDPADFIVVKDLKNFDVKQTWLDGKLIAENGSDLLPEKDQKAINNFSCGKKSSTEFSYSSSSKKIPVIGIIDGQLMTKNLTFTLPVRDNMITTDIKQDVIKLAVVNRYSDTPPAVSFIHGTGLTKGAFASTVAHDSHNIIVAGVDDESICDAVNLLVECKGGLSIVGDGKELTLPLPIAGLMSDKSCELTGGNYSELDQMVKEHGSHLRAPFMTLSFMALLVIPELKLSDKGLFDGRKFEFV